MFNLLLKLVLIYAAILVGLSLSELATCHKGTCTDKIERAARNVVEIDWRPISIFSEEAQRFR